MSGESEQKTLAIVGLGLIGASIAEATRKRHPHWRILAVSSSKTIHAAIEARLIKDGDGFGYNQIREVLEQCDIGFLCTPIDEILKTLQAFMEHPIRLKPGAIISDVGSTKEEICALGKKAFPSGQFIGSHPMAGSEKTGIKARDAHLFENAVWILCPEKSVSVELVDVLGQFAAGLGARTMEMPPDSHDFVVAYASHLPQLVSTALAETIVNRGEGLNNILQVAGGGFRDMTRLAASSFSVWQPILHTNRMNIRAVLKWFAGDLEILRQSLNTDRDGDGGKSFFETANSLHQQQLISRKGFSSPTTEILVDLEDHPGALMAALKPLYEEGINILDLEILKVREGEEGTLMMGFRKPEEAQNALDVLAKSGHEARLR